MRRALGIGAALAMVVVACVGDEAQKSEMVVPFEDAGPTTANDGAPTDTSSPVLVDANPSTGSCAGKTFATPVPIKVTNVGDAATAGVLGIRLVGTTAYYTERETEGGESKIYRGKWTPPSAGGPALDGAVLAVQSFDGNNDRAATVAPDSSFVFLTRGPVGTRKMWSGRPSETPGVDFTAFNAGTADFNGDEADPWLVGNPPRVVYWGRGDQTKSAMRITRGTILLNGSNNPLLENVETVGVPCPLTSTDNCGTPVVTRDETTMLFAAWVKGDSFAPNTYEVALTPSDGGVTPSTTVVPHPELGIRNPSWISDDGCEVLLSRSVNSDLAYAKRTP